MTRNGLTDDERAFLDKYRQLDEHDRGYIDAAIEALAKHSRDERKKDWTVRKS